MGGPLTVREGEFHVSLPEGATGAITTPSGRNVKVHLHGMIGDEHIVVYTMRNSDGRITRDPESPQASLVGMGLPPGDSDVYESFGLTIEHGLEKAEEGTVSNRHDGSGATLATNNPGDYPAETPKFSF